MICITTTSNPSLLHREKYGKEEIMDYNWEFFRKNHRVSITIKESCEHRNGQECWVVRTRATFVLVRNLMRQS